MKPFRLILCLFASLCISMTVWAEPVIYINQVGFDSRGPKIAVIGSDTPLPVKTAFSLVNTATGKAEFNGTLGTQQKVTDWYPDKIFYEGDFSQLTTEGHYKLNITVGGNNYTSDRFTIPQGRIPKLTTSPIIH